MTRWESINTQYNVNGLKQDKTYHIEYSASRPSNNMCQHFLLKPEQIKCKEK